MTEKKPKNWTCGKEEYRTYEMAKTVSNHQLIEGFETRILYRPRGVYQVKRWKAV